MRQLTLNNPLASFALAGVLLGCGVGLHAQQSGTSNPPTSDVNNLPSTETGPDDQMTVAIPHPTPTQQSDSAPASLPQENVNATSQSTQAPLPTRSVQNADPDGDIVHVTARSNQDPNTTTLNTRANSADPDGDIVQPHVAEPGEILAGTTIRVRLTDRLSTATSEKGEIFHSRVASDVYSGEEIVIPAGSEIDGRVVKVSTGTHLGSSGSMRLRPEKLILPDGSSYYFNSDVTGTPGSNTKMGDEGTIKAGSRTERDGIEYGGGVGAGAITGAAVAGPVGALTGGLVGAGLVTAHLLVSHPQATLENGTVLLITLTDPLHVNPIQAAQN